MSIGENYTYEIEAATEQWTDMRVIHVDDLEDLLYFCCYGPKVLSQLGYRFKGYQLRQRDGMFLLTVKVMENDTPLVVFLSSATTMGCMRLFVNQLQEDRIKWVRDKFPWN